MGTGTIQMTSLQLLAHDSISDVPDYDAPYRLQWGETHIEEQMLGLTFRVSPRAFFQVCGGGVSSNRTKTENPSLIWY